MNTPVRRLLLALAVAWLALLIALSHAQLIAGPDYRSDPRNVRLILDRLSTERGPIISADGELLAFSQPNPADDTIFLRRYPHGELYAHVIGYTSFLFGDVGLEAAMAETLESERNATLSGLLDSLTGEDVRALGLRLTIDHDLQAAAEAALGEHTGAIVAIDPASGAILALVSNPSFDPNTVLGPGDGARGRAITTDPARPDLNRAISEGYAPGSTFKVITAAAGLDTRRVSPATEVEDVAEITLPGTTTMLRNAGGEPCSSGSTVAFAVAFARSCNTVFATLGIQLGARLEGMAAAFGFGLTPPLELPAVASILTAGSDIGKDPAARAQTAIGQRDVRATPLQMALAAAAVANRGSMMAPYLVADIFDANGQVVASTSPSVWRRPLDSAQAEALADMMELVVTSGTGTRAAVPGIGVAGKTGTAENGEGLAPHAWFIGFAPTEDPVLALAVFIEGGDRDPDGVSGGRLAAPIARQVFEAALTATDGGS